MMIIYNQPSIRDVVLFPQMKNKQKKDFSSNAYENYEQPITKKIDFSNVKIEPLFEETVDFDTF